MASPTIESLCCLSTKNAFSKDFLADFQSLPYNLVSIIASILGITGAVYQVLPRTAGTGTMNGSRKFLKTRGRLIIRWLALADLMASLGILIRSVTWLADDSFGSDSDDSSLGQCVCIITSAMIHYFYTATYCWTFLYALDVKLVMQDKRINQRIYHLVSWTVPVVLCLIGLLVLYLPDLNCHSSSVNPYIRFLPNYLSSFIPIVVVMIGNPILYCLAFSRVEKQIMSARGRFTQSERRVVNGLLKKFFLINAVFYLCWLPNIINGIVLWSTWQDIPRSLILVIWYLMAILNPLQAVFNCIVYRSWDSDSTISKPRTVTWQFWRKRPSQELEDTISNIEDEQVENESSQEESDTGNVAMQLSGERAPLLQSPSRASHALKKYSK
ncbi:G-protein coupled receptor 143 [Procambarus clarkii]|uniref:G-protein coupled receptor 143 n=1 Tax=Procambarus clarkii TaxID=6728 RepID=UPI001E675210|nr:G-protein coupled receptor 143-like [Procambarus clarkii]XP_045584773.1 G-protein coupled receptor 143-like [Procambarus clarkii]